MFVCTSLMFILHKLPLTSSTALLISAYAALSIMRRNNHLPKESQSTMSYLPLDMQLEIMQQFFDPMNFKDEELLNLSLTSKYWHKIISQHPSWLKERLAFKIKQNYPDIYEEIEGWPNKLDLFGADELFSPKIAYFLVIRRSLPMNMSTINHTLTRFSNNSQRYKVDQLYVPWLNHNLAQRPETLWKFIKTILIYPVWLYPFIIWRYIKKATRSADVKNRTRISELLVVLFILLSFLPFLDGLLFRPDALVSQIKAATTSENTMQYLLWDLKPWSFGTFFRTSINLLPTQFLEISLADGSILARLGSIALLILLSIGPVAHQLVMVGFGLIVFALCKVIRHKGIRLILAVCYMAPWIFYLAPLQTLFLIATLILFLFDLFTSADVNGPESFKRARGIFIIVVIVFLSNLV